MPPPSNPELHHSILPALHHALSGASGTLISTCATYPLSLVTSRLQVQRQLSREGKLAAGDAYAGIGDALSRIWSERGAEGWRALYSGLAADAAKSVLDSFLFFLFYEWFRTRRLAARTRRGPAAGGGKGGAEALGVLEELAVGMAAGACSRAFTTPIANVVTRKQTAALVEPGDDDDGGGGSDGRSPDTGMLAIVRSIRAEKGIAGLWAGYSASLVLTANPSITFFLQEFLKKAVLDPKSWDDPGPQLTFLLAAVSKAVASTITYPFQIAKTRLQVGTPVESDAEDDKQDAAGERDVHKEVEAKLNATRAVRKLAQQSIFGTVAQIVQSEGVGSLYDGIQGELLKGFFSHGTTMLAKDKIHKLLFKLYLVIAGMLQELRARRASSKGFRAELPRALQFRTKASCSPASSNITSWKSGENPLEYGMRTVLNIVDGSPRGVDKD